MTGLPRHPSPALSHDAHAVRGRGQLSHVSFGIGESDHASSHACTNLVFANVQY